jgi:predicted DCC family thiol-disulfide oxidoreductase YuxK
MSIRIIIRAVSMITVLYDGYCVICKQSKRIIQALDWQNRVEFLDIHRWNEVEARYPALDFETAMGQMHTVMPDGSLIGGFDGMRCILRELPLGLPLWLILHLPGANWLGPKIYRLVARNRYRINKFFGVDICENNACKVHN